MLSKKNFLKNTLFLYLIIFLTTPLSYLTRIIYSKSLELGDFGLIYSIFAFLTLISIFIDFGLTQALAYYIPKFNLKNNWDNIRNSVYYAFLFQLITSIIVVVVLFFLSDFLELHYFQNEFASISLKIFLIMFFCINIVNVVKGVLIAFQKVIQVKIVDFMKFFFIFTSSIFVFLNYDNNLLVNYVLAWSFSHILLVLLYFIYVIKVFPELFEKLPTQDFQLFKKLFGYGFYLLIGNSITVLLTQIDIIMITFFLSTSQVGLYSNSISVISILAIVTLPISIYLIPVFSELSVKKDFSKMSEITSQIFKLGFLLILPISLTFFLFSKEIILILFSEAFLDAHVVLSLFGIFGIFQILSVYNYSILSGLGLLKNRIQSLSFVLIINILLNILLIPFLGILGAAISTIFSWFLSFLFSFYLINSKLDIDFGLKKIIKFLLLGAIFVFSVTILKNMINVNIFVEGIIVLGISTVVYMLSAILFKVLDIYYYLDYFPKKVQNFINFFLK